MIFDGRPASQITADDIRQLRNEGVPEDQFLELKREPYGPTPSAKKEMLKDVTAFANAEGGYIIIGVDEDGEGRAAEIVGVDNPQDVISSLRDRCLSLIEPRLTALEAHSVMVDDCPVVVCYVPESGRKPHASVPDREHHYFWQRYQNGVKLMTVAEIREAFHGDVVHRELVELRRELAGDRRREVVANELQEEVDERGLLRLETLEAFAQHARRLFQSHTESRPYFRLTATPDPVNALDLRQKQQGLLQLLYNPPKYRMHGFDVGVDFEPDYRREVWGFQRPNHEYKHLRAYWNGHVEFWNAADDDWISWAEAPGLPVEQRPLNPNVLIESTASFVQLARAIVGLDGFDGELEFRLELWHVKGRFILPYAVTTSSHMWGLSDIGGRDAYGRFQEESVCNGPLRVNVAQLPGTMTFDLIKELYYLIGYESRHIPYFDDNGRCEFDIELEKRIQAEN